MNIAPFLARAFSELDKGMQGILNGTKIEGISNTISYYAIASALTSMAAAIIPGGGGAVAGLAQAGIVWATYVKINRTIGLSMSEETSKFIGNAILTNLVTTQGALLAGHVLAGVISLIPIAGTTIAVAGEAAIGYAVIYVSAYLYIKLLSRFTRPDGEIVIPNEDNTSGIIKEIMSREDMKGLFKEASKQFKEARKNGELDAAKGKLRCPNCGTEYEAGDCFCSLCGKDLTK